ncbi:MAG: M23 family metallopeptidase, partial [Myxococcales bacterium]|nr:M23 family metallopeptidase [Myxococcales bacterium]
MRRRAVVLAWLVCGCASSGSGESADSTGAETTMTVGSAATVDDSESASSSESAGATGSASAGDTDSASTDGASGGDTDSESATGTGDAPEVVWPISASPEPDADAIRHPYGPRWIGQYDFHAGVDINVDVGTPVHAIAAGTVVSATPWDGESTSGNTVLVEHAGDRFTAYLHLSELLVEDGQPLEVGEEL